MQRPSCSAEDGRCLHRRRCRPLSHDRGSFVVIAAAIALHPRRRPFSIFEDDTAPMLNLTKEGDGDRYVNRQASTSPSGQCYGGSIVPIGAITRDEEIVEAAVSRPGICIARQRVLYRTGLVGD